jgi:hypothetical protein
MSIENIVMNEPHHVGCSCLDGGAEGWEALLDVALSARPEITALIHAAIAAALHRRDAEPADVCVALAHAMAEHASRSASPVALLSAACRMAQMFARGSAHR